MRNSTSKETKVKELTMVFQPTGSKLCGQACVAMILGITLEQSIIQIGKRGCTNTKDLVKIINRHQPTKFRLTKVSKHQPIPTTGLLKVKWDIKGSHWVLTDNGFVYDPIIGKKKMNKYLEIINGRITSFLELDPIL